MSIEEKIKELNIKLPDPKEPVGSYVASKIVGNLLYISGQISINDKGDLIKGKIGKDLDVNQGYEAAKRCGLAIISQVKKACNNDLSKVKSCIKLTGYVNSTDNFIDINFFSSSFYFYHIPFFSQLILKRHPLLIQLGLFLQVL